MSKQQKQQREAEEYRHDLVQMYRRLAYVHAQRALEEEKKPLVRVKKKHRKHIKKLKNQLEAENYFLPAQSQEGICTFSSGFTETLTKNDCTSQGGVRWTPLNP
jgi:hypothetical protein